VSKEYQEEKIGGTGLVGLKARSELSKKNAKNRVKRRLFLSKGELKRVSSKKEKSWEGGTEQSTEVAERPEGE